MTHFLVLCAAVFAGNARQIEPVYANLFNGKDFTGWEYKLRGKTMEDLDGKTATADKRFEMMEGIVIANPGKGIADIYTKKPFSKDFHLKLEFRAAPRADSGVYIRGKQLQVRDYPTVGPYKKLTAFKNGDWNELDILVTGTKALCKCNGEVLEKAFQVPAQGAIGLQAESGKFEFRRVRVKVSRE